MQISSITPQQAISANLNTFCMERGTDFAESSIRCANLLLEYIHSGLIVDLGTGDGVAAEYFLSSNHPVIAVDINQNKLSEVPKGITTVHDDMLSFLQKQADKSLDSIFLHPVIFRQ